MKAILYKLMMMLIAYLTSPQFISLIKTKVKDQLDINDTAPESLVDNLKKDDEIKDHNVSTVLMDAVIGLVTHEELQKRKIEVSPTVK